MDLEVNWDIWRMANTLGAAIWSEKGARERRIVLVSFPVALVKYSDKIN